MEKILQNFRKQIENTQKLLEVYQKQNDAGMQLINGILDNAPESDKAEVELFRAKLTTIMNDAKNGGVDYVERLQKLTQEVKEKYQK